MSGAVRLSVPGLFRQSRFAEADGNRTRLRALALTPVLKTGGPTRSPDASTVEDTPLASGAPANATRLCGVSCPRGGMSARGWCGCQR